MPSGRVPRGPREAERGERFNAPAHLQLDHGQVQHRLARLASFREGWLPPTFGVVRECL
jgi:hypothetical protein